MTVDLIDKNTTKLSGVCPLEDAEMLFQLLLDNPGIAVDWTQCERAHTAVVQVLLAAQCSLKGPPAGTFLKAHIEPAILRAGE